MYYEWRRMIPQMDTESSDFDSPDMNSSVERPSPERRTYPRKLHFNDSPPTPKSPHKMMYSPEINRIKALRLFDSPKTPRTLLASKLQRFVSTNNNCQPHQHPTSDENCEILAKPFNDNIYTLNNNKPKPLPLFTKSHHDNSLCKLRFNAKFMPGIASEMHFMMPGGGANVNPFTPPGISLRKKRARFENNNGYSLNTSMPIMRTQTSRDAAMDECGNPKDQPELSYDEDLNEFRQAPKRLALQDSNITRYEKEFVEIKLLGEGEFGLVYQCLNRLDGCIYAIKRSIKPVAGSSFEKTSLNEVYAHAVLGKHDHVVRYYSAWAENNHMLIQNEYCNGGSLQQLLAKRTLDEAELKILLLHVAEGLRYIHSHGLVHMDIKAGNIFLTRPARMPGGSDEGFDENQDQLDNYQAVMFKIGDLGHVTSISDPKVEEGDCRYLPNEILQEDYTNLPQADIFSLGITIYEAGGGGPLPKNGPEWHSLRNGKVPDLPGISRDFNKLIKLMTHPNPEKRPSSTSIFSHSCLCPTVNKSKAQLLLELNMERTKNEALMKKLRETTKIVKSYELAQTPVNNKKPRMSQQNDTVLSDRTLRSTSRRPRRCLK